MELCLLTKDMSHLHPRKLPKLIKIGLPKNIHRKRLFVLSKPATFRLGFSRQLKEAWSLKPMGANLINIGSFEIT